MLTEEGSNFLCLHPCPMAQQLLLLLLPLPLSVVAAVLEWRLCLPLLAQRQAALMVQACCCRQWQT